MNRGSKRFPVVTLGATLRVARAAIAVAPLAAALGGACRREPPLLPATRADGQWIWSATDLARWRQARATRPALRPGVWTSTVWWQGNATGGAVRQRLALSPAMVAGAPMAVLVRFDDRLHAAWLAAGDGAAGDSAIAAGLDARLAELLRVVGATGADVREVQLDYDCPVRRLARWAAVVARLRRGALAGREVWITSLPSHVAQRDYGAHFRGVVSGHILQVFDTGVEPSPAAADRLVAALDRAGLPYRLGVGAFERVVPAGGTPAANPGGAPHLTRHRAWFALAPHFARSPAYRGLWVFPGEQPWEPLAAPSSR